jgi:alpha-L-fucosidase
VRVTPAWFDEAKLGCFVHWNPATIPAFAPLTSVAEEDFEKEGATGAKMLRRLPYAEMYQNTMAIEGSPTSRYHEANYGDAPYDDFVARFRDEMIPGWSPEPLADLIAAAGARYAVLFTMTEDGFLMWPSETPNPVKGEGWQSRRDVVGELGEAVRARGVRYGVAYSGGMDWTFADLPLRSWQQLFDARPQSEDYIRYADAHWLELIERYRPDVLWNDYSYPRGADVAALFDRYLELVPEGVVNNRWGPEIEVMERSEPFCDFITPEYSVEGTPELKWEACRGLGTSFGFNREESAETYMSSTELIHLFVDVVARGGNLLINVGPTATGIVPFEQAARLLDLGWWLRVNGEAIYSTRPWERHDGISGEGTPIRFTRTEEALYAIVLGTPSAAEVEIDVRLEPGASVSLLGPGRPLEHRDSPAGTRVRLPERPDPQPAFSLRISPPTAVTRFDET